MKTILKGFVNIFRTTWKSAGLTFKDQLFDDYFINGKLLYLNEFGGVPIVFFVANLDSDKALAWLKAGNAGKISRTYQRNYYDWDEKKQSSGKTFLIMEAGFIIELSNGSAYIYYAIALVEKISKLVDELVVFEEKIEVGDFYIYVISRVRSGFELKELNIQPTDLDISLYYNDDFKEVDEIILERLDNRKDKGIILLHGLPGTGKTTYLRHLVGKLKKKVLFVSPNIAGDLMDPEFIDLLIDNPNAVLVIEDAENIILDRRYNSRSGVGNLLNISDGLLSDCLNVQLICTFNSALHTIDPALLRKGRLIARYEFGKLAIEKARRLSEALGMEQNISAPMTLAEITNPNGFKDDLPKVEVIGFRRQCIEN
jgi:hypothetical protein